MRKGPAGHEAAAIPEHLRHVPPERAANGFGQGAERRAVDGVGDRRDKVTEARQGR